MMPTGWYAECIQGHGWWSDSSDVGSCGICSGPDTVHVREPAEASTIVSRD